MPDKRQLERIAALAFALLIWQLAAVWLGKELLLVTPVTVAQRLVSLCAEADFLRVIAFSFVRIVGGFLLALVAGSLCAVIAGRFRLAEILFWPFSAAIKSVPVASFVILCLIWLSSNSLSVFISFLMVFPLVYTNLLQGLKNVDRQLLEMAEFFRIGWLKRVKYIYLPQIQPYLFSACSIGIGMAWKAGVAAEVIGIPNGSIGEKLYQAKIYLLTGDLFAWTTIIVFVSMLFEKLFMGLLHQLFVRWGRA
jgi:NitT/TauT family transport system permease protein